jgi:predicted Zn-dependent peptidase
MRSGLALLALAALTPVVAPVTQARVHAQATPGERLPVREVTLDNGMRFLILRRQGAPTVSFVTQFGVGGVNEHLGTTGIAHLLEHMLFKGTSTIGTRDIDAERALFARMDAVHDTLIAARARGDASAAQALRNRLEALEDSARGYVVPSELDRMFTEAGARGLNATTSNDATTYFVELPANRAELWFALEADRMSDAVFREYYTERDVVTEERRLRIDSSPFGRLYEEHLSAAYTLHPYGVPVVGYMSDLETLSRRDVAAYYRRFYGPGNAVVAVVGDIDPDEAEAWARRYFEQIPTGEAPPPVLAEEPRQVGERRITVVGDAEPRLRIGWHVPSALHEDAPAIAVLAAVLSGGRTTRLQRRLVQFDRTAAAVSASAGPGERYPRLFFVDAVPRSPHTTEELERAIYEEIARLVADGPTEEELERVRNQIEAGNVRRIESNLGLAFQLADSELLTGDWRSTFRESARLGRVTADDVRRVASAYLTEQNRTVAVLVRGEAN